MMRFPVYTFDLIWNCECRKMQIVILDNNPLVGVSLLDGCRLEMEFVEGAEVLIEFG